MALFVVCSSIRPDPSHDISGFRSFLNDGRVLDATSVETSVALQKCRLFDELLRFVFIFGANSGDASMNYVLCSIRFFLLVIAVDQTASFVGTAFSAEKISIILETGDFILRMKRFYQHRAVVPDLRNHDESQEAREHLRVNV